MAEYKKIGEDVRIHKTAIINHPEFLILGNKISIDIGVYISVKATIGDYVHIAPYSCITGGIDCKLIMGHFSGISAGCKILCGSDNFVDGLTNPQVPLEFRNLTTGTIRIENFAVIGVNSVIMPNITIGEGSTIGAGSIVTEDTEPWTVYVGSPAKPIKKRVKHKIIEASKKMGYNI